jgi:hypothetical protein
MLNLDADDADTQLETLNGLENVMAADAGVVLHDDDDDDELSEEEEEEPATAACLPYKRLPYTRRSLWADISTSTDHQVERNNLPWHLALLGKILSCQ